MKNLKNVFSGWPAAIRRALPAAAAIVALLLLALRLGLVRENVYYLAPPLDELLRGRLLMFVSTWLVAAICLYCGCAAPYLAFLVPELAVAVLCKMPMGVYEYICALFFPLVFTLTALLAFHKRGRGRFVFAVFTLLGALQYGAYIAYVARFHGRPSATAVMAALSSHAQEAAAFLSDQFGWGWVALAACLTLLIFFAARALAARIATRRRGGWLYLCLLTALAIAVGNLKKPDFYGNFFIDIRNGLHQYRLARKALALRREKQDDEMRTLRPRRQDKGGELLLVVIGESANRQQHGCFGYKKNTTPWLSSAGEEVTLFGNAYACMTHTEQAVTLALNRLNNYSPTVGLRTNMLAETMKSISLIEVLRAVGTRTYWFSAQNRVGTYDSFITSQLAMSADEARFLCDEPTLAKGLSHHIDGELVDWVRNTVNSADPAKDHVIFLHLIGSHWPTLHDTPPDWPFVAGDYSVVRDGVDVSAIVKAYDR
ncbi:MAG: sulfatase-like hydrolase/transferase, partial [Pyramidobacter sp.]|nr:sulfatase-like hydrolase/transferase [Pyramidobacter sp.]